MKLQELNIQELKSINGGDNSSVLTGLLEGFLNIGHTDDDGDTESTNVDFGLGSLLGGMFD
ncbi:MAG: bacteriocin [Sphingobacteriales bacterium]|nr:MAG: bacteriocin [Sphingobacteriales bacterium]